MGRHKKTDSLKRPSALDNKKLKLLLQILQVNLLYGCKVKPTTRYAFSLLGLAAICAKTGTLKVSVILISLVALTATLVTAKPFTPSS